LARVIGGVRGADLPRPRTRRPRRRAGTGRESREGCAAGIGLQTRPAAGRGATAFETHWETQPLRVLQRRRTTTRVGERAPATTDVCWTTDRVNGDARPAWCRDAGRAAKREQGTGPTAKLGRATAVAIWRAQARRMQRRRRTAHRKARRASPFAFLPFAPALALTRDRHRGEAQTAKPCHQPTTTWLPVQQPR
jgi:hypothetical protein